MGLPYPYGGLDARNGAELYPADGSAVTSAQSLPAPCPKRRIRDRIAAVRRALPGSTLIMRQTCVREGTRWRGRGESDAYGAAGWSTLTFREISGISLNRRLSWSPTP